MNCCRTPPGVQMPWNECEASAVSFKFTVRDGWKALVKVHRVPEGLCMCVEECIWTCCCTRFQAVPVLDECGCPTCVDECTTFELPPGEYQFTLADCDGMPVVPVPEDVLVTVHHI